jgi:hypothetical protein
LQRNRYYIQRRRPLLIHYYFLLITFGIHPDKPEFIDTIGWKQRKKKPIARLLFSIIEGFIEEGYVPTRVAALSLSTAK